MSEFLINMVSTMPKDENFVLPYLLRTRALGSDLNTIFYINNRQTRACCKTWLNVMSNNVSKKKRGESK